jgi:hypothetical protein
MTHHCGYKPVCLCALVLFSIGSLRAQDSWIRVTTVRLKPEMIQEWRNTYKNKIIPGYRKAGVSAFAVWRYRPFGDAYELMLMSPIQKFAQFDGEDPLQNSMRAEERVRIESKLDRCVSGIESMALLSLADLSVEKENVAPQLIMVQTVSVAPKNASAYLGLLKDEFKPLIERSGVGIWLVYRHVFGSETSQITTIRSIKNYAELDAGPLAARLLGPQAASILSAKTDLLAESSRIVVAQYDKELSYGRIF